MVPEAANQKRKRGRPTNASRDDNDDDASKTQLTLTNNGRLAGRAVPREDPEAEEDPRPRKRGRPVRAETLPEPETESSAQSQGNKRKRGQPSLPLENADKKNQGKDEHTALEETQPKKRGRGARNTQATKRPEQKGGEAIESESIQTKKGGRPKRYGSTRVEEKVGEGVAPESKQSKRAGRQQKGPQPAKEVEVEVAAEEEADDENEENSSFLRRSDRTSRLERDGGAQHGSEDNQEENPNTNRTKRQGQKGKTTEEPPGDAIEDQPVAQPKKKRGRSSRNDGSPTEPPAPEIGQKKQGRPSSMADTVGPSMKPKPARRNRLSQNHEASVQDVPRRRRSNQSEDAPTSSRRFRRSPQGPYQQSPRSASPDSDSSPPPYRHLTTRTRRVPRHTIDAKWTPLDASSVSSVTNLLHSASRPVLIRLNNLQRHKYATAALNTVSNRLHSKLTRGLPFPPATTSTRREDELEFERTVSGIQALESQLDPLLHSVELLKREKARAEKELEREYRILNQLGTNARAEKREKRERLRKMHVLVPEKPYESNAAGDALGLTPVDRSAGRVFAELGGQDQNQGRNREVETELHGLVGQIGNHMESMRGNLQQIDGIVPAIAKSRAFLSAALQQHLDREVLEGVVLG
ncbi:CENP-Q, a CENPA-CAD centromere complex subunit-domain-containing protein [Biscogniauxia marginata]|nr:CENP-Q, a CENPA-CAD centromere complex subunit-domain-containing protein [Biscogniauxia marginata]